MSGYDWSTFKIVFYYAAPQTEVFSRFATGAGLESFFLSYGETFAGENRQARGKDDVAQPGDEYVWKWLHGHSISGRFISVAPPNEVSFTFGAMDVSVKITEVGGKSEVVLVQSGIDLSDEGRLQGHLNCRSCWIFFLTNLKSVLENDVDLRDSDPSVTSSMEVGFVEVSKGQ